MVFKDYYKILGFNTNKVSIDDIKLAYREKAKIYHPDMNVFNYSDDFSEEIFKDINEAYKTLSNKKLKRKYDFNWRRYVGKNYTKDKNLNKTTKNILFDIFLGESLNKKVSENQFPIYGEDIYTSISISINDAFFGVTKSLEFKELNNEKIDICIPKGTHHNDVIKIIGKGKKGQFNGKNGNLFVTIKIKNSPRLCLSNNNLIYTLPITCYDAALGCTKKISILQEDINVIIPPCTNSDDVIIFENKGFLFKNNKRGNLSVKCKIIMKNNLSNKEIKLFKTLKEIDI